MTGREHPSSHQEESHPGHESSIVGGTEQNYETGLDATYPDIYQDAQGTEGDSSYMPKINELRLGSIAPELSVDESLQTHNTQHKREMTVSHAMDVDESENGREGSLYPNLDILPFDCDLKLNFDLDLQDQLLFSPNVGQQTSIEGRHHAPTMHIKQNSCPNGTLDNVTAKSEAPNELASEQLVTKTGGQRSYSSPLNNSLGSMSMPDPRWGARIKSQTDSATTMMDTEALIESIIKDAESFTEMSSPTGRWKLANNKKSEAHTHAHVLSNSNCDFGGQFTFGTDYRQSRPLSSDSTLLTSEHVLNNGALSNTQQHTASNDSNSNPVDVISDRTDPSETHQNIFRNFHSTDGTPEQFNTISATTSSPNTLFDMNVDSQNVVSSISLRDLHKKHRDAGGFETSLRTSQLSASYYVPQLQAYAPIGEPSYQYNDHNSIKQESHRSVSEESTKMQQNLGILPPKFGMNTDELSSWLDGKGQDAGETNGSGRQNSTGGGHHSGIGSSYEFGRSNSLQPTSLQDTQFQAIDSTCDDRDNYGRNSFQAHDVRHAGRPLSFDGSSTTSMMELHNGGSYSSPRRNSKVSTDMITQSRLGDNNSEIGRQPLRTHSSKRRDKEALVDAQRKSSEAKQISNSNQQVHHGSIVMELCSPELWRRFKMEDTEMIMSSKGRQMFPQLKVIVRGLDPKQHYAVWLHFSTEDKSNQCWKWTSERGKWEIREKTKKQMLVPVPTNSNFEVYNHPWVSATGQKWMEDPISFDKLRLTNDPNNSNYVLLAPFRRYVPVLYIIPVQVEKDSNDLVMDGDVNFFRITLATFISSSAYHNTKMASLKIETNPMAKSQRNRMKQISSKTSGGRLPSVSSTPGTPQNPSYDVSKDIKNEQLVPHRRQSSIPSQRQSPYTPHASEYKGTARNGALRRTSLQATSTYTSAKMDTGNELGETTIGATRKHSLAQPPSAIPMDSSACSTQAFEPTFSSTTDNGMKIDTYSSSAHSLAASINGPFIPTLPNSGAKAQPQDTHLNSIGGL